MRLMQKIEAIPRHATKTAPRNPSLFSMFLVISFSIGLVRFWHALLNFLNTDKLFFHFFQSFFERSFGHTCRVKSPFNGTRQWLASFFFHFF